MNGFRANGLTHFEKWSRVNQTLNKHRIAILALQETHLDQGRIDELKFAFGKKMEILYSPDPVNPRASAGVAIVINKSLIAPRKITTSELKAGRALLLKVEWLDNETTSILNVYAPNDRGAHQDFWKDIETTRRNRKIPAPNFVLRDFNVTEDPIDRMPPRLDDQNAIEALRDTRLAWGVADAWRTTFPENKTFTYRANTANGQIKSRLDRIYIARHLIPLTYDWKLTSSSVPTDHWLVAVKYAPKEAPQIGRGRWTLPLTLTKDKNFMNDVVLTGITLQQKLERLHRLPAERTQIHPQQLWETFKENIKDLAKQRMKTKNYRINARIDALHKDLDELNNNPQAVTDNGIRRNESILYNEIKYLEGKYAQNKKDLMNASLAYHGEHLGGIWSATSKERKPRDYIRRLKLPNSDPPQYERDSYRMAELAREYHASLQTQI